MRSTSAPPLYRTGRNEPITCLAARVTRRRAPTRTSRRRDDPRASLRLRFDCLASALFGPPRQPLVGPPRLRASSLGLPGLPCLPLEPRYPSRGFAIHMRTTQAACRPYRTPFALAGLAAPGLEARVKRRARA